MITDGLETYDDSRFKLYQCPSLLLISLHSVFASSLVTLKAGFLIRILFFLRLLPLIPLLKKNKKIKNPVPTYTTVILTIPVCFRSNVSHCLYLPAIFSYKYESISHLNTLTWPGIKLLQLMNE